MAFAISNDLTHVLYILIVVSTHEGQQTSDVQNNTEGNSERQRKTHLFGSFFGFFSRIATMFRPLQCGQRVACHRSGTVRGGDNKDSPLMADRFTVFLRPSSFSGVLLPEPFFELFGAHIDDVIELSVVNAREYTDLLMAV